MLPWSLMRSSKYMSNNLFPMLFISMNYLTPIKSSCERGSQAFICSYSIMKEPKELTADIYISLD